MITKYIIWRTFHMIKANISNTKQEAIDSALNKAVSTIKTAITTKGEATVVLATGMTYIDLLGKLASDSTGIQWDKVTCFHLDEYVGIDESSKGSFKGYLKTYFTEKASPLKAFHYIDGTNNAQSEVTRLSDLIKGRAVDLAFTGIGNNGHLAFNEPPADFDTDQAYLVADLDDITKDQQFSQGWYKSINDVPSQAITMSIPQILKSEVIICAAFGSGKADIVHSVLSSETTNLIPATALNTHSNCEIFLDAPAASKLSS